MEIPGITICLLKKNLTSAYSYTFKSWSIPKEKLQCRNIPVKNAGSGQNLITIHLHLWANSGAGIPIGVLGGRDIWNPFPKRIARLLSKSMAKRDLNDSEICSIKL
jgi:hypothetical protein